MVHDEHTKSKSNSNSSSSDPDSAFRSRVLARMLSKINQTANFGNGNPPAQFTAAGDGISLTPHNTSSADERAGVGGHSENMLKSLEDSLGHIAGTTPSLDPLKRDLEKREEAQRDLKENGGIFRKPNDPMRIANEFLRTDKVVYWREQFYIYSDERYKLTPVSDLRPRLTEVANKLIEAEYKKKIAAWSGNGEPPTPPPVTTNNISSAMQALSAKTRVPSEIEPPCYLRGPKAGQDMSDCVVFSNGLLKLSDLLKSQEVKPAPLSPDFFNLHKLDYALTGDFRIESSHPTEWIKFLQSIWPKDPEAIDTLQEVSGYLLSGQTRCHKIFFLLGPPRSGKSTICRVLQALMGHSNCLASSMSQLSNPFGLSGWIGKKLAIFPDMRISGRYDDKLITNRLLAISGDDPIDIERKYLSTLEEVRLGARILVASNELPRLPDSALALASRFIVLRTTTSFLGREDRYLTEKLLKELPSIFWWSLDGLKRLQERIEQGKDFLQPSSGQDDMDDFRALSNPIVEFVEEYCFIDDKEATETCADVYLRWQEYAIKTGLKPLPRNLFSRNLKSCFNAIKTIRDTYAPDPESDGAKNGDFIDEGKTRKKFFKGIRLRKPVAKPSEDS
ncbi:hypothetical protein KIH39_04690 [Telmatocola sphagniphila]|uniref:SF3 helicase domain-containing protein n=1 Tax=Telmatocola sphagniphila TaxID=1123043 RepID=A0A8E6EZ01_9BACT|nr:phage/plasmid primase, P4 family [Telmatocola sphagniphila]QVL33218.1 hypothetical protein KIH39_04690 [Telmatocola sphagniphila]